VGNKTISERKKEKILFTFHYVWNKWKKEWNKCKPLILKKYFLRM
jgi:hypothetical protein